MTKSGLWAVRISQKGHLLQIVHLQDGGASISLGHRETLQNPPMHKYPKHVEFITTNSVRVVRYWNINEPILITMEILFLSIITKTGPRIIRFSINM